MCEQVPQNGECLGLPRFPSGVLGPRSEQFGPNFEVGGHAPDKTGFFTRFRIGEQLDGDGPANTLRQRSKLLLRPVLPATLLVDV